MDAANSELQAPPDDDEDAATLRRAVSSLRTWSCLCAGLFIFFMLALGGPWIVALISQFGGSLTSTQRVLLTLVLAAVLLIPGLPTLFVTLVALNASRAASSGDPQHLVWALIWSRRFLAAATLLVALLGLSLFPVIS